MIGDGFTRASWQWKDGRRQSAAAAEVDADLMPYARAFSRAIGGWLQSTGQKRMRAEVFSLPKGAPLRVIRFILESQPGPSVIESQPGPSVIDVIRPQRDLADVLAQIGQRLGVQLGAYLVGERELRVHGPGEIVVIKPVARRFWMRGRAIEDADAVVAESLVQAAV